MANEIVIAEDTPIVIKDECSIIVEALENAMSKKLRRHSPLSDECCIFRVPEVLRRHNPKAYGPDVVSIGPFHRRNKGKQFKLTEKVKQWYLHHFLSLLGKDLKTLIQSIDDIVEFEKRARKFYAEPLDHLSQNELIEMMILDGCFLLELFRRKSTGEERGNTSGDPIFNMVCMLQYLCHDLFLLENQLPWFVLQTLYSLAGDKYSKEILNALVLKFFIGISEMSPYFKFYIDHLSKNDAIGQERILHILDLARSAIVFQPEVKLLPPAPTCLSKAWGKLTSVATAICSLINKKLEDNPYSWEINITLPSATHLSEAGVKFCKSSAIGILNVKFENGVFELPELYIGELTEPLFRNLVSFEQCYHGCPQQTITSYVLLMDRLMNTSKDMDLLSEKKIIINWLSSETASPLFNNLYDDTFITPHVVYWKLCDQVNKYYHTRWHRWLEKLRGDYFGNPWTIISLIAAIFLLVLTILQTVYTTVAYYSPR